LFGIGSSHPIQLCPVCLRKVHAVLGFDIEVRYLKMLAYCLKHGQGTPILTFVLYTMKQLSDLLVTLCLLAFETQRDWYQKRVDDLEIPRDLLEKDERRRSFASAAPGEKKQVRKMPIDQPLRVVITMNQKSGVVVIQRRELASIFMAAKQKLRAKSLPSWAFLVSNNQVPLTDNDILSLSDGVQLLVK